jgi:hypothetical protein
MKTLNEITLSTQGFTICGPVAHDFNRKFRTKLDALLANKGVIINDKLYGAFLVYDSSGVLKAAQSTKESAKEYMNETRVLITFN